MFRYHLVLEYDGSSYVGWQSQINGRSIQGQLENAIFSLFREKVSVFGAGRTDSGVHAYGQSAHFDAKKNYSEDSIRDGLNFYLKLDSISILEVFKVNEEFHARFSAIKRKYRYLIFNRRPPPTLFYGRVWHVPQVLNYQDMHESGQFLVGKHDFSTFRSINCQAKSPVKTIETLEVIKKDDHIIIDIEAPSFLHNQVRSITGSLKLVGEGKWPQLKINQILSECNRSSSGPVAPAHGLYLFSVTY